MVEEGLLRRVEDWNMQDLSARSTLVPIGLKLTPRHPHPYMYLVACITASVVVPPDPPLVLIPARCTSKTSNKYCVLWIGLQRYHAAFAAS